MVYKSKKSLANEERLVKMGNSGQKKVLFTGVLKTLGSIRWTSWLCVLKLAVSDTTVFPFSEGIALISVSFVSTKVPISSKEMCKYQHTV